MNPCTQMEDKNGEGSKFYCIKAVSKINAKATDVYELLKDPGGPRYHTSGAAFGLTKWDMISMLTGAFCNS